MPISAKPSTDPVRRFSPRDIVRSGLCIGCGGCVSGQGADGGVMRADRYGQLKPAGPPAALAARSGAFARTCPFSPGAADETRIAAVRFPSAPRSDPFIGRFEAAYVGHVAEGGYRAAGSSGGLTSWTAAELLRRGLVDAVAHVKPVPPAEGGGALFRYAVSRSVEAVQAGAQSRYYPVELSEAIETIRQIPGRYAVVGVPCFIKAVHLLRAEEPALAERVVFTLGLFCGHMKSARMTESFAWQMGVVGEPVERIDFRVKDPSRPANWYRARIGLKDGAERSEDWWRFVDGDWGAGYFQNSACDFCDDVTAETADISFGDAWVEPYASDGRGTNVVVARSPALDRLLREGVDSGRLRLDAVDEVFVRETQAAGLRQRREGLAYRLTWARRGVRPVKRVAPQARGLSWRRKAVYRMRRLISVWSHRLFYLAARTRRPGLYTGWARVSLSLYQGLTYSRGRAGAWIDRLERLATRLNSGN